MATEARQLETAGAENLVMSEIGAAWVEANPEFVDLTEKLCAFSAPEDHIREETAYLGSGMYSEVRSFAAAAIKVSSATTGKKTSRLGTSGKPEQLINQFLFLSRLGQKLALMTDGEICTPDQYLAFRTPLGSYVRVEEYMKSWINLHEYNARLNLQCTPQEKANNKTVKSRLVSALRDPIMRIGLNDLGLEKREYLHAGNVMVPQATEDLESTPLCIIDQPGCYRGYLGRISLFLANFSPAPAQAATSF